MKRLRHLIFANIYISRLFVSTNMSRQHTQKLKQWGKEKVENLKKRQKQEHLHLLPDIPAAAETLVPLFGQSLAKCVTSPQVLQQPPCRIPYKENLKVVRGPLSVNTTRKLNQIP